MKSADFESELTSNGQIPVPPEIASQIPSGKAVRVVLEWGESEDEAAWRAAGRRRFETAYSPDDSIYEQLIDDAPTR